MPDEKEMDTEAQETQETQNAPEDEAVAPDDAAENPSQDSPSEPDKKKKKRDKKEALEKLQKELDETKDSYLRLMAEYQNYRNRTAAEKQKIYGDAKADCIEKLLSVLDCFERAAQTPCSDESYKKGMDMTHTQMRKAFEEMGLTEIAPAVGEAFDPKIHHAIKQVDNADQESDTVCEVFQKGYRLGERLLRPAMVAVAL